ncbi:MAG TPA: MBOAT family O-acyltransferase [Spirochaetota bacterium]|nr:MBOAT family O-acyltransferase [Spirochaetota bacterium]HPS85673.1 MBOAT family O-acyltransferase [Spirochaetota bacterium]
MHFHSWSFLLFFITVYVIFSMRSASLWKRNVILAASFIFYGWWNPLYILLISWVIAFDYTTVLFMERTGKKKLFLSLSIIDTILILCIFKYSGFIVNNINSVLSSAGIDYSIPLPGVLLPVGISFFLFLSLGNTIDYYFGRTEREKSIIQYASFVSFFPSLLAGPIERGHHLIPLLKSWPKVSRDDIAEGVYLFTQGMFKKMALADYFSLYADKIFGNPMQYSSGDLLAGALAFTWQIYFDFSGYTDMARGVARMLGIRLIENFNLPYMAASTGDFWGRWHISLSSWFRDYLYIPLGGNRNGEAKETRNTFATMLISGLWHGASWNYVLWGFMHAALHTIGKQIRKIKPAEKVPLFVRRIIVFILIIFTWIFFRSENAGDAFTFIERIFTTDFTMPQMPFFMAGLITACYLFQWLKEYKRAEFLEKPVFRGAAILLMLAYIIIFVTYSSSEFIYFQF